MCLYIRVSSLKSKPYKGSDKPRAMSVLFFPSNREDNEVQGKFPLTEVCLQSIAFFFFSKQPFTTLALFVFLLLGLLVKSLQKII